MTKETLQSEELSESQQHLKKLVDTFRRNAIENGWPNHRYQALQQDTNLFVEHLSDALDSGMIKPEDVARVFAQEIEYHEMHRKMAYEPSIQED